MDFINICKEKIVEYHNKLNKDTISENDLFIVWYCKTLQNKKVLISGTGSVGYYEVTFNGDKNEIYLDHYEKVKNVCYKL